MNLASSIAMSIVVMRLVYLHKCIYIKKEIERQRDKLTIIFKRLSVSYVIVHIQMYLLSCYLEDFPGFA